MPTSTPTQYIVFEGPEGGGKSTQLKHLAKAFAQAGLPHRPTREAGGTETGKQIREVLIWGDADKLSAEGETLLFYADRQEHLRQVVRPALLNKEWVLADRSFISTRVYQTVRGVNPALLTHLEEYIVGPTTPTLTLVLDLPSDTSLARKGAQQALDRFEQLGDTFHQKIRLGFLNYLERHPENAVKIDATQPEAEVHAAIVAELNRRFGLSLATVI